jgi:hypothetical protein
MKSDPDHLMRLVRAIECGVETEVLTAQQTAVFARVFEKRKRLQELEKEKAQIEAELSADEKWLDEVLPRHLWDSKAAAPILSTPHFSPADGSGAPAGPAQGPPRVNDLFEAPGLLENSGQHSPGRASAVNPEARQVDRKIGPEKPLSATDESVDWPQTARIK